MRTYIEQRSETRHASRFMELDSGRPTGVHLLVWRHGKRDTTLLVAKYRTTPHGVESLGIEVVPDSDWPVQFPGHINPHETTLTEIVEDTSAWPQPVKPVWRRPAEKETPLQQKARQRSGI
jgi:hypothetical protein